MILFDQAMKKM